MPTYPVSDHCDGEKFFNPDRVDHGFSDAIKWIGQRREKAKWPRHIEASPGPAPAERVAKTTLRITVVNHSTVLIQAAGYNILTDPIWSQRCSPVSFAGPRRVRRPGIRFEDLPPIDVVLLSHNHYDHMDLTTLRSIQRLSNPRMMTGLGNSAYLANRGLPNAADHDWWDRSEIDEDLAITFVPARHFSARGLHDRNRTLWGGFIIDAGPFRVYFAGDSGYGPHFAEIGKRFPDIDAALIPIGAYEPRWFMAPVHVNPEEAVRAHVDCRAARSLAIHHSTFQLTDEAIDAPVNGLHAALAEAGLDGAEFEAAEFGDAVAVEAREKAKES